MSIHVDDIYKKNTNYFAGKVIGRPGTTPLEMSCEALSASLRYHSNNIGTHTFGSSVPGFEGTQEVERDIIQELGHWYHSQDVDGYICSGGTIGNMMGILIGRNINVGKTAVIYSELAHYCIKKSAFVLGIEHTYQVECNVLGQMRLDLLEDIFQSIGKEIEHIILVCNAGTTILGGVDEISSMYTLAQSYAQRTGKHMHVHVDAAFGGFVLPFVDDSILDFQYFDSIVADFHKTGLSPYGIGAFLCRKGCMEVTSQDTKYVPGGDFQIEGSRSAAHVVSARSIIEGFGKLGFQETTSDLLRITHHIRSELLSMGVAVYEGNINVITIEDPGHTLLNYLHNKGYYALYQNGFPFDSKGIRKKTDIWQIIVMKHFIDRPELVEEMIHDIRAFFS